MVAFLRKYIGGHHHSLIYVYMLAICMRILFAWCMVHDWDGYVLTRSANDLLAGKTPYDTVEENSPTIYPDTDIPIEQQWYAYPPLPILSLSVVFQIARWFGVDTLAEPASYLTIFLIKIPLILGDIFTAQLFGKIFSYDSQKSRWVQKLILFNPLIIFISSIWGMFDIWMVAFLLLSIVAIQEKNIKKLGLWISLMISIKTYALFLVPSLLLWVYVSLGKGPRAAARVTMAGIYILLYTIIQWYPFFITAPRGFMSQLFVMHLFRSPQQLSIPALYYKLGYILTLPSWPVGSVMGILLIVLSGYLCLRLYHKVIAAGISNASVYSMHWLSLFGVFLVCSKVSNEQYFVMQVCFVIMYLASIEKHTHLYSLMYHYYQYCTYGVLIISLTLGFHLYTFFPPQLTYTLFDGSNHDLAYWLSGSDKANLYTYPPSLLTYYNAPILLALAIMIGFFLLHGLVLQKDVSKQALSDVRKDMVHITKEFIHFISTRIRFILSIIVIVGFMIAVVYRPLQIFVKASQMLAPIKLYEDTPVPLPKSIQVGAFYNIWWHNLSHYPSVTYDGWKFASRTPIDGYYTSKHAFFVKHIKQMKKVGIDLAIVPYHLYEYDRFRTFAQYADNQGIWYSPMIEVSNQFDWHKYRPIDPDGKVRSGVVPSVELADKLVEQFLSAVEPQMKRKGLWKKEGKPVVFIYDAHWLYPSFTDEWKKLLTRRIVRNYSYDDLHKRWGRQVNSYEDVLALYPKSFDDFLSQDPIYSMFYQEFIGVYKDFWNTVIEQVESRVGDIYTIATYAPPKADNAQFISSDVIGSMNVFDAQFAYSPANTWVEWKDWTDPGTIKSIWSKQISDQASQARASGKPVILPVMPEYDDHVARPYQWFRIPPTIHGVSTYDWTWHEALKHDPDLVLIATWNEAYEGTTIEPSQERGYMHYDRTRYWTEKMKSK